MKRASLNVLILATLILYSVVSANAWDDVGHKITAYIAWQQMKPAVRERVIAILRSAPEDAQLSTFYIQYGPRSDEAKKREFFMVASTWADIIRDRSFATRFRKYHHSNWHYSDTFWTDRNGKVEVLKAPDDGGLALERIVEFIRLESSDAKVSEKAIGIAWLQHLIGDVHQPLHTSARVTDTEPKGDQGGNLFLLTPVGIPRDKQENLHWYWDSIVVRNFPNTRDLCDADFVDPLARSIMRRYPPALYSPRLAADDPERWKRESFEAATVTVFSPILKRNEMPPRAYERAALRLSEERLALAGYRMGVLFNQLFETPAARPASK